MNGHQALIDMRRGGLKPTAVFVVDGPETGLDRAWTDPVWGSNYPCIAIGERDIPEALDLRYAVGLQVHIDGGRGDERAKRLHDAFAAAGARIVGTITKNNAWTHHG